MMKGPLSLTIIVVTMIVVKASMNWKNKLMALILMEMLFLIALLCQVVYKMSSSSVILLLYVSVFMVLDSTVGICILMSSSRNSYNMMHQFGTI